MESLLDAELSRRFCYWRGRSGRRYIHTIYERSACPPLPGALYVAVASDAGGGKRALAVGRFPPFFELLPSLPEECTEVHAHLLSGSDAEARVALEDLCAVLAPAPTTDAAGARSSVAHCDERAPFLPAFA
ncbi:MAG: hypothetical protein AB7S41_19320 [Parvibaculaceae bacterium]